MNGNVVHCQREAYDIYIGRGDDPRTHRPSHVPGVVVVGSRQEAIRCYRIWLWEEIRSGRISLEKLAALHGKRLGCWCASDPCHGEVLATAAAWAWRRLRAPQLFAAA